MSGGPPFALAGIDHVVLLVDGVERALAFYRDLLGCPVERRVASLALTQLRAGAALIDLIDIGSDEGAWARPDISGGRNMDHVALALDRFDREAIRAWLISHGVAIESEGLRYGAGGEGPSLYVRDPDGNLVELKGPADS